MSTRRRSSRLPPPLHPRPRLRRQTLPPPARLVLRARHPPLVSRAHPRPRRQLDPLPLTLLLPALATCSLLRPRCELADMSSRPVLLALLVGTIRRTVSPTPGLEVYLTDIPRLTPVDPAGTWTERTRKDAGTSSDSPPRRMLTGSLRTGPDTYGHYYVRKQSTLKEWSRIMLWIAAMFAALVLIVLCLRFGSAVAPSTYLQSLRRKAVANEPPFEVSPPFASPNAISVLSYALIAWIVYGMVQVASQVDVPRHSLSLLALYRALIVDLHLAQPPRSPPSHRDPDQIVPLVSSLIRVAHPPSHCRRHTYPRASLYVQGAISHPTERGEEADEVEVEVEGRWERCVSPPLSSIPSHSLPY